MSEKRHAFRKFHPRPAQKITTRRPPAPIVNLAAGLLAIAMHSAVLAQVNYPTRPVRIIVPTSAASAADTVARVIAQPLAERLGQPVVVEVRAGAGAVIGTEAAAKSAPDGHTLLMGVPALAINTSIYRKLPYDVLRDFTPITQAVSQPNLLAAHPSLPAKSVKELIALAKARPGELEFASSGIGASSHLTMELFLLMTGTRMSIAGILALAVLLPAAQAAGKAVSLSKERLQECKNASENIINYYGVRGNSHSLSRFFDLATACAFKWLNRRGASDAVSPGLVSLRCSNFSR